MQATEQDIHHGTYPAPTVVTVEHNGNNLNLE